MIYSYIQISLFLLFHLILQPAPVPEQSLQPSLFDKVDNADIIIIGEFKECESRWCRDKTVIYTYWTVSVEQRIKGKSVDEKIFIRLLGGIVGDVGMMLADDRPSNVRVGSRFLLFLIKRDDEPNTYIHVNRLSSAIEIFKDDKLRSPYHQLKPLIRKIKAHAERTPGF